MKSNDIKIILEEEMKKQYEDMGKFVNDQNPQVKELYNRARGGYDAIDDIYYKLFHHYVKID